MEDRWEFYPSLIEDESAAIFVNLGFQELAPIEACPELIRVRVSSAVHDDGLSSADEESESLFEFEDRLIAMISEVACVAHYVGRITVAGSRVFFIYSNEIEPIQKSTMEIDRGYPEFETSLDPVSDPDWEAYLDFLCPTPRELQLVSNCHIVAALEEAGDELTTPRLVEHWSYFADSAARDKFAERIANEGFEVIEKTEEDDGDLPFALQFSLEHAVDYGTVGGITLMLFDTASELGGSYDGWETPIVTEAEDGD